MTRGFLVALLLTFGMTFPRVVAQEAAIEGKVTLPPSKKAPAPNPRYQVPGGETAKPQGAVAVVYLEGQFATTTSTNTAKLELGQKNFQFTSSVLVVQKGATVDFPNHDNDYHNVFSYSKAKRFDLGRYRKDEKPAAVTFDQAGVIKLFCEIHDHMRATILVVDTPHFVTTDAEGNFKLQKLPAGKFTLKVWAEDKSAEKAVELKAGETLKVDFPSL